MKKLTNGEISKLLEDKDLGDNCQKGKTGERLTRIIFEKLTGFSFSEVRKISFLDNKTLDGYNKDLNVAFEYQGSQHYEIGGFHQMQAKKIGCSPEDCLAEQKATDQMKVENCIKEGVSLLVISYRILFENLPEIIHNFLIKNKINVIQDWKLINVKEELIILKKMF